MFNKLHLQKEQEVSYILALIGSDKLQFDQFVLILENVISVRGKKYIWSE